MEIRFRRAQTAENNGKGYREEFHEGERLVFGFRGSDFNFES